MFHLYLFFPEFFYHISAPNTHFETGIPGRQSSMCRVRFKSHDHVSDTFQVIEIVLEQDHVKMSTFTIPYFRKTYLHDYSST